MNLLEKTCASIAEIDSKISARTQAFLDRKTKPLKSLGKLEELACILSSIQNPEILLPSKKVIVVLAADHGVVEESVSAYPQAVTAQMLLNFASGGAAINVLARQVGAEVRVVDMGVVSSVSDSDRILVRRIGAGTKNFTLGPAMTREQATRAIETGILIAQDLAQGGANLIGLGEMGIGNTTSSSALVSAFLQLEPEKVTGYGTGINPTTYAQKIKVIKQGLQVNMPNPKDPLDVLSKLGGFEIAGLVGVALGCGAHRIPVVLDGFITSSAALVATRFQPKLTPYLIASHLSVEIGHAFVLSALNKEPLFDLQLRLGEGTGAALAMNLIEASLKILTEMATFESAGVSQAERG